MGWLALIFLLYRDALSPLLPEHGSYTLATVKNTSHLHSDFHLPGFTNQAYDIDPDQAACSVHLDLASFFFSH